MHLAHEAFSLKDKLQMSRLLLVIYTGRLWKICLLLIECVSIKTEMLFLTGNHKCIINQLKEDSSKSLH